MEDLDIIKEFLIESEENLTRLDQEIVDLERDPTNADLIASIFRTIHTIKGTCGFLGFTILTEVSHCAESILSQVRERKRPATVELINIILESIDAIKQILKVIEATGLEGNDKFSALVQKLKNFADGVNGNATTAQSPRTAPQLEPEIMPMPKSEPAILAAPGPDLNVSVSDESEPVPADAEQPREQTVEKAKSGVADSSIRVDVGLLDRLMNLVGELVLARNQVLQFSSRLEDASLSATSQRLNLITSELQEGVMKTRMQPVGIIWSKFPRVVRDIAGSIGKQIHLTMDGADTELDRTIIEAIKDPLTHIIRNSCDHGIERPEDRIAKGKPGLGHIAMRAFHEGGHVVMEISDDGAGINPDKVKKKAVQKGLITAEQASRMNDREALSTIFLPGFSTAEQVSNISGRGVGMDVVKTNIERIGGIVDLVSGDGPGTTVKIKIPLTLAIIPGLIVTSGGERFVIPQVSLSELVRLEGPGGMRQIERVHNARVYRRRGKLLPLTHLSEILEAAPSLEHNEVINIAVLQVEGREFGLIVDEINDTQEIVVKPLGKQLKDLTVYSGATIMGDGRIALILDVLGVAQRSYIAGDDNTSIAKHHTVKDGHDAAELESLLLFAAGEFERVAVPLSKVVRLEEIPQSTIERAAGSLVTQYRGQILSLVPLVSLLGYGSDYETTDGKLQVIVFKRQDGSSLGVIVDRIIDIVHEHIQVRRQIRSTGILGSAVIGKAVTDLLDFEAIINSTDHASSGDWPNSEDLSALAGAVETNYLESAVPELLEV